MAATRIKRADNTLTTNRLVEILDNIPAFIQMPIRDRGIWAATWNSRFPRELVAALQYVTSAGYEVYNVSDGSLHVAVQHEGRLIGTPIRLNELQGEGKLLMNWLPADLMAIHPELVNFLQYKDGRKVYAMALSFEYMTEKFGTVGANTFMDWIVQTADFREEIANAVQVIEDVFYMVKTAGQLKRMIPDLLQYLPVSLRKSYEEQKRASSLPFEWAPYPKGNVERMLLTLSKGHLLKGMSKAGQEHHGIANLDLRTWGGYADVVT